MGNTYKGTKPNSVPFDHYAVAEVRDGKVVNCLAAAAKLSEVLWAVQLHGRTQVGRQSIKLLRRTAFGFKIVRLAGGIV